MNALTRRLLTNIYSIVPIVVIVLLSHFIISPLPVDDLMRFLIGAVLLVIGLTLFLIGIDLAITPLGQLTGTTLIKSNSLWLVIIGGLLLGFFISIAEPGLLVLAGQIDNASGASLSNVTILIIVSLGLAIMTSVGFLRIIYRWPLYIVLLVLYGLILVLSLFSSPTFIAIAFDASGATTGVLAVPFILSLAFGISAIRADSKASEKDSFGLVAVASTGPIFAMLLLGLFDKDASFLASVPSIIAPTSFMAPFFDIALMILLESLIVLTPLLVIFLILNFASLRLKHSAFSRIIKGFIYTIIGLFIFLLGVNGGFMNVGRELGTALNDQSSKVTLLIMAFLLGALTIIAEPAVHVLTSQIEEVTSGYIKPKAVYVSLAFGVGLAILLSALRVNIATLEVWHLILPMFVVALGLMFFTPKIFIAIAFDAGGVATGPIIVSFIVAFIQGVAANGPNASLADSFGMIALVAIMPIITLEILGIIYKAKSLKGGIKHD